MKTIMFGLMCLFSFNAYAVFEATSEFYYQGNEDWSGPWQINSQDQGNLMLSAPSDNWDICWGQLWTNIQRVKVVCNKTSDGFVWASFQQDMGNNTFRTLSSHDEDMLIGAKLNLYLEKKTSPTQRVYQPTSKPQPKPQPCSLGMLRSEQGCP